jgi:uncharacterized protein
MTNPHGDFIWYELLTSDADAAQDFYGNLLGWTFDDSGQTGMDYRIFNAGSASVGGVMPISADMAAGGARPLWLGYIGVDDVDASVIAIGKAGGTILMPADDIPGVGRIAMVADGQGAPFYIMRGESDQNSSSFAAYAPRNGHCAWNELASDNPDAAVRFYTGLFGWRQEGEMDMGSLGNYRFFHHGAGMIGAVMTKMPDMPVSLWSYYFRVPDIDAAIVTINAGGGTMLRGPDEIPGGDFSINAMDPQGAAFALVGSRK